MLVHPSCHRTGEVSAWHLCTARQTKWSLTGSGGSSNIGRLAANVGGLALSVLRVASKKEEAASCVGVAATRLVLPRSSVCRLELTLLIQLVLLLLLSLANVGLSVSRPASRPQASVASAAIIVVVRPTPI